MQRTPLRLLPLAAGAGLLAVVSVTTGGSALAQSPGQPLRPNAPAEGDRRPPPPALPGLAGRRAPEPIPADPARAQALSPNEALFDAIARGDLAAARDAVARGADLNARNVLGLTPLDAAVDQRRDEIAFFLLSARGGSARGPAGPPPPEAGAPSPQDRRGAADARRGGAPRAQPVLASQRTPGRAPPVIAEGQAREPAQPRLFAGDGGTPVPEIGFLGFDAGRPPGSVAAPPAAGARRGGRS
ncbi:ankyrin repeat domain-containing protein [Caldovatus aquaticus]|uniref:Ankyrin repeat domain-containing protein n=1 Tax=Caldovatus aquaticus TaxID=2865671 RepID=A0ABS7F612_9PROT|nr:ankyrin repeat domain-containing protein [Caldovatus aquaticus]MBW8271059.1 ankyrin repeat domain-containing protein [Caldovatus aquaticus]